MPEQLQKDRFRNDSGGTLGVSVRRPGGLGFKSIPILPGEVIDLDEEEQAETANAPKDPRNNILANGALTIIREGLDWKTRRPTRHDPNLAANTAAAMGVPSPDGNDPDREIPGRAPAQSGTESFPPPPGGTEFPDSLREEPKPALSDAEINARIEERNRQLAAETAETGTQVEDLSATPEGERAQDEETGTIITSREAALQPPAAAPAQQGSRPRPQPRP